MSDRLIKVAIVDDHPLIIDGLQAMFARYPHIQLVGCYGSGAALLEGLDIRLPDILLLDLQLPDNTGDKLAQLLQKKHPNLKIIVLTNFDSTFYINNMMKLGVHGYLLKSAEEGIIIKAIDQVHQGKHFIEDAMQQKIESLQERIIKSVSLKISLTPREKDILQHIAKGETNKEIAKLLFLSVRTVENYRLNIQLKLGAKNTAVLILTALQNGLLDK